MNKPRVLMKDVAKVAGVHQTTVSLALRNHPSLPQSTRDRIQKLATEMGYRPDPALSALVAYRQATKNQPSEQVIAWIVNFKDETRIKSQHVHRALVSGARERAQELGYKLDTFWFGQEYKDSKSLNRVLKARGIQAVVLGAFDVSKDPFELDWSLFSTVKVNQLPESLSFDSIHCNQMEAVNMAVSALREKGIRRIGLAVSDLEETSKHFTFAAGFHTLRREIAAEHYVPPLYFKHDPDYHEDVLPQVVEWAREHRTEAIISNWNSLDAAAMHLCQEGQPCRFVSLDADERTLINGGIDQNHKETGRRSIDLAVGQIKTFRRGIEPRPTTTLVTPKLIPLPDENPLLDSIAAETATTTSTL